MAWQFDDGGRADAGFKGQVGDCVVRSIAIAAQLPYQEVYDAINIEAQRERPRGKQTRSSPRTGVARQTFRRYLETRGWVWHPTMQIGSGCKVHLCEEELPMGRLIVKVSRHMVAVIDRVIHDNHNPTRCGVVHEDGVAKITRRCVYGYFTAPANG